MDKSNDSIFRWILTPIVVFSVVFSLAFIFQKQLYAGVEPIGIGITNETLGLENVYEFKDKLEEPLLNVKVEAYTKLKNLREESTIGKQTRIKDKAHKHFNLTFLYEKDSNIFVRVPNDYLKNVLITFNVDNEWVKEVKEENIKLFVWNERHNAWTENKVYFLRKDKKSHTYRASSPYHGLFAIAAK